MGIKKMLNEIRKENLISFHMPGHKNGRSYSDNYINVLQGDITEIPGSDNLHYPTESIKETQDKLSKFYGSINSFISVNGASACVLAGIFAMTKKGDKVIVSRDCHKSVYNALILRELNPIFIMPQINEYGVTNPIDLVDLNILLQQNEDAVAIIITSPTYMGLLSDIKELRKLTDKYDMYLMIDEAHGSHLPLMDIDNKFLGKYAHISVESLHKTMACFTQTAVINVNFDENLVDKVNIYMKMFQTTSPSYLLMESIDHGIDLAIKSGKELIKELLINVEWFKNELELVTDYKIMEYINLDKTKVMIYSTKEIDYNHLEMELRMKHSIQCEFSNTSGILFICSLLTTKEDLEKLLIALKNIVPIRKNKIDFKYNNKIPKMCINPSQAIDMPFLEIDLLDSINKISKDFIVPYPPGVPLIYPGEIIDKSMVEYIIYSINNGITINGISNNKIRIVVSSEEKC
jgi:arginine/lysine/ornithine decarboxylase